MAKKLPLTTKEFETIYHKVPRANVEIIVKTDRGIVLTKRSIPPAIGSWHIPGGTIYYGERVEDSVKRIAMNELGVEVEVVRELGHIEYPKLFASGAWGWPIGLAFEVKIVGGKLSGSEQGEEVEIFSELPEGLMADQRDFLERVGLKL